MPKLTTTLLAGMMLIAFSNESLRAQSRGTVQQPLTDFSLQSSVIATQEGSELSDPAFQAKDYWFPVTVPTTVLTGLVTNHVYPDPYIGMNNMRIPDASDSFNAAYHLSQYSFLPHHANPWKQPYWYRTTFTVPAADRGKTFQLLFKGINYRAAVWVNGKRIADSSEMAGMFATYSLDVTGAVKPGERNGLAVEIYPLDYPGLPAHPQLDALGDFYANGGPTGDIGKNVTMLCSVGWDWIPAVRDRNMGIWQPVYLRTSGAVTIAHARITTDLPRLPDTSVARLGIGLDLVNHSGNPHQGKLSVRISPENFPGKAIAFTKPVTVHAAATGHLQLDADQIGQLILQHPRLWWPNGYGTPNLYRLQLRYEDESGLSDDTSLVFGIRTVSSRATDVNGWMRRDFYVNGERIHLTGGAWVPDMMLNRDSVRYDEEIRLCRNAHINLLRIWGGGVTPPDVFFDLADRYGMLVWQDFWVTGDTQGEFKGSRDWPLETPVFIRNMTSTIYRIRNHASLLVWTGGNEGHARKELYDALRDSIVALDGTRPFIPSSSGYAKLPAGWKGSWPDNQPSGVYSGGPYSWQDPAVYYQKVDAGKDWVFKDETGIPSQPPYETLSRIIPDLVSDSALPYPLNNTWGYHDACSGNGKYDLYYQAMVDRYGKPVSMRDFSEKTQLLNANGYRGIFEAAAHKLNETGGVMLWKLNAAFPSVIWQIYDWYLEPNAGYYFMQRACEPVHIQLNLDDSQVAVINKRYHPTGELTADVSVIDLTGKVLYHHRATTSLEAPGTREIDALSGVLNQAKGVSFVVLTLEDAKGGTVSHNTYWVSPDHRYQQLSSMSPATLQGVVLNQRKTATESRWTLRITNTSGKLAFFTDAALRDQATGKEVLPSYWSDNYFSLAPHQSLTITLSCPLAQLPATPEITLKGWNVASTLIALGSPGP